MKKLIGEEIYVVNITKYSASLLGRRMVGKLLDNILPNRSITFLFPGSSYPFLIVYITLPSLLKM